MFTEINYILFDLQIVKTNRLKVKCFSGRNKYKPFAAYYHIYLGLNLSNIHEIILVEFLISIIAPLSLLSKSKSYQSFEF